MSVDPIKPSIKNILNVLKFIRKGGSYPNYEEEKDSKKRQVELNACFLSIQDIENIKQRFVAIAQIEAKWIDNSLENDVFDPSINWTPKLYIENAIGQLKQTIKYKIEKQEGRNTYVYETRHVKGTFYETLELNDFPLDIQDLSLTVTTTKSVDEIELIHSFTEESSVNTSDFRMEQEWKLYPFLIATQKEYKDIYRSYNRPALSFQGKIARKPGYYLNNAYLLMFLISALGFMPFSFIVTAPNHRINSTVMLILSSINFKIAVTTRLPIVSYLTVLDKYAFTVLIYLGVLCSYHSIIASLISTPDYYDSLCFYVFSAIYILFHVFYILYFLKKYFHHKQLKEEYELKVAELKDSHNRKRISVISLNKSVFD